MRETDLPFKPNYTQRRGDRNRVKDLRKQEKLQRREDEAAKRKVARNKDPVASGGSGTA